jgi:transcriptional regulator with XRE-family HTH domain
LVIEFHDHCSLIILFISIMKGKEEFLKAFGKHLQKARKAKGLSIREAELNGDVTRQFLSDVENGKVNFTFYNLKKIADVLDMDFEELFRDFRNRKY